MPTWFGFPANYYSVYAEEERKFEEEKMSLVANAKRHSRHVPVQTTFTPEVNNTDEEEAETDCAARTTSTEIALKS